MIHRWKALDLEITDGAYQFDRTYTGKTTPSETLNLKHVEIIKFLDKPTYDTSLESLDLEITDFNYDHNPTYTGEITQSQTSNLKHLEIIKVSDKATYDTSLENS